MLWLKRRPFTFEELLIKCVDALGNDDGQCGSAQQPGPQDGHQLQLLLHSRAHRDGPRMDSGINSENNRTALPVDNAKLPDVKVSTLPPKN